MHAFEFLPANSKTILDDLLYSSSSVSSNVPFGICVSECIACSITVCVTTIQHDNANMLRPFWELNSKIGTTSRVT